MAVRRVPGEDTHTDTAFFKEYDKESILIDRIKFYIEVMKLLPSHKWFKRRAAQLAVHKQVMAMVLLEIEWENYTRKILIDYESNKSLISDREKVFNQLNKLQKNLGLTSKSLSEIPQGEIDDEAEMDAMIERMSFMEKHA